MKVFDYKKAYKDLYLPKAKPMLIDVPKMSYVCVHGKGNPNEENGDYKKAIQILYGISYVIKMSKKSNAPIDGYFDYVVPPLEGLWWMNESGEPDFLQKDKFNWISMIRLPEFADEKVFQWAFNNLQEKHPEYDMSHTHFMTLEEGLCIQIMHKGSYDDEPSTIQMLHQYINENGFELDFEGKTKTGQPRYHHEIYLSDPRKAKAENLKTVIRLPIKKVA